MAMAPPRGMSVASAPTPDDRCRLDVWLWRTRFFKTRSLAARFIEAGLVRLTRDGAEVRVDKASRTVRPGDRLVFSRDGRVEALLVLGGGERRGPASEARGLYARLEAAADADPRPLLQAEERR